MVAVTLLHAYAWLALLGVIIIGAVWVADKLADKQDER